MNEHDTASTCGSPRAATLEEQDQDSVRAGTARLRLPTVRTGMHVWSLDSIGLQGLG